MTIAGRFEDALAAAGPELDGAELLPTRLARACARMLPVDGAGLSMADAAGQRIPLGASSEQAAVAERLQFTVADGPCMTAQATREPVFAVLGDLHRRWPPFAELLVAHTPYRAVVGLPLRASVAGLGAVDLYFADEADVPGLDVFEALAVGDLIASELSDAAVLTEWEAQHGPGFLRGPSAGRRAAVWEAVGRVGVALEVDSPAALDLMRARAWSTDRTVDDLAAALLTGELDARELRDESSDRSA